MLGVLLIVTALCAGAIFMILHWYVAPVGAFKTDFSSAIDLDTRAVDATAGLFSEKEANPSDQFSYEIKRELVFSVASEPATLLLKNPRQNQYLMTLELVLEESGEVVLRTGALLPGQMIKKAALDEKLVPGDYKATANICAVDAESGALAGVLTQPVTIVVKA